MAISAKDVKALRERTNAPMMECKKALEETGGDIDAAVKVLRERGIAKMAKRSDRETAEGVVRIGVGDGNSGGTAVVVTCETDFTANNDAFQSMADAALATAQSIGGDELTSEAVLESSTPSGQSFKQVLDDTANSIRENMGLQQVVRYGGVCGSYVHFNGKSGTLIEAELGDAAKGSSSEVAGFLRDLCMHVTAVVPAPLAVDSSGISQELADQEREIFINQAVESGKPKEIAEKMVEGRMKKFFSERALLEQPFVKDPGKTVAAIVEEGAKTLGTSIKITRFSRFQIGE